MLDSNSRHDVVPSGSGANREGTTQQGTRSLSYRDGCNDDGNSSVATHSKSRAYRIHARVYSGATAFGFAVIGIYELFRK